MPAAKPTHYREAYIRIIQAGVGGPPDFEYAAELIQSGLGTGHIVTDVGSRRPGGVSDIIWTGPTVQGRLMADEMASELAAASLKARAAKWLLSGFSGAFGLAGGLLLAFATKMFGLC